METSISTIFNAINNVRELDRAEYSKNLDVTAELVMIDFDQDWRDKFQETLKIKSQDLVKYFSCWRDIFKYLKKLVDNSLKKDQMVGYLCYIVDKYILNTNGRVHIKQILKDKLVELQKNLLMDKQMKNFNPKVGITELLTLSTESKKIFFF